MNAVQRESFDAAVYLGVLRRRWLIVVAGTVIGLGGAFAYAEVAPKTYTATAEVNVTPTGASQANTVANSRTGSGSVNLDTEAQIVTSATVATGAAKIMKSSLTSWQLTQDVTVTVPPNSSDLDIACGQSTASGASTCANTFATAYLKYRSSSAAATLSAQLHSVQAQVTSLEQQASTLSSKVSSLPANSTQRLSAQTQLTSVQNQLHTLTTQVATLNGLAANVTGGSIITSATPPGKPTKPAKALILPSGLVAGLLIGLILAFLIDRRDKRLHTAADVERLLDVPVLLDLPGKSSGQQLSLAAPRSKAWRGFTELARAVATSMGDGNQVVVVAGTTPGAGGSLVAANLAAALARTHPEVVLVCANIEDSVAPDLLGIEPGRGFAEVLAGRCSVREVARGPAGIPGLWVITPGADPAALVSSVQHDRAKALVAQLRDARYVVIDVQATDEGADTFSLAEFADAALIVTEIPRTTRTGATACITRLTQMRTPILGAAVLPAVSARAITRPPKMDTGRRPASGLGRPEQDGSRAGRRPGEFALDEGASDHTLRSPDGRGDPVGRFSGR